MRAYPLRLSTLVLTTLGLAGLPPVVQAAESTGFRLLAIPRPWTETVTLEGYYDQTDDADLDTGQEIRFQRYFITSAVKLIGSPQDTLLVEATFDSIDIDASDTVVFPNTGSRVPGAIDGIDLGLSGRHIDSAGRRWVGSAGIRSRSSDLTDDEDSLAGRFFAAIFFPTSGLDGWTAGLSWQTTADYPVPLVSYTWVPSREFRAIIGFPFLALQLQPAEQWEIAVRNFAVNPGGEVTYKPNRHWSLFTRVSNESWDGQSVARRQDDLVLEQEGWRLGLGAAYGWGPHRSLRIEAGWEFERELVEKEEGNFFSGDEDSIDLDDAAYGRLTAAWAF